MVTLELSLLVSATVTPPAPAGFGRITWNGADRPKPTVTPDGRMMDPVLTTVRAATASGRLGDVLAWITVEPGASAVTSNEALRAPPEMFTLAGILTIPLGIAVRVTTTPLTG